MASPAPADDCRQHRVVLNQSKGAIMTRGVHGARVSVALLHVWRGALIELSLVPHDGGATGISIVVEGDRNDVLTDMWFKVSMHLYGHRRFITGTTWQEDALTLLMELNEAYPDG